jgi:energy-coupling factor transporter ATP-binding protein EcfA2
MTVVNSQHATTLNDPVGAVWRRWEPHIHTPGTAMNDNYKSATLSDFLDRVEQAVPTVECLGITDYYLTRRYEEVQAAVAGGRLPGVSMLFCNIELRYSIETKASKGINIHLLVSPDDPRHVDEIKRFLAKLKFRFDNDNFVCTEDDLRRLGRAYDPSIKDDEAALQAGVNQFKVDFNQLREEYKDSAWMRKNVLIAVAGSSNDGTAGLQDGSSSFAAMRRTIEACAHIIFAATPKNIEFWRGEGTLTPDQLVQQYGGPKPCLHGSDAHSLDKVAKPDNDRLCWIKGDPTFEALKQACFEPSGRVSVGAVVPETETPYSVRSVATPTLSWLLPNGLPINPGMVAIIGARGSGKTALADLIAHAGDSPSPTQSPQSFISRARNHVASSEVIASWSDGMESERYLGVAPEDLPEVHYLTQQFVDRLCSSEAESDELLGEIKRVVFLAHEPESRLGADDFDALVELKSSATYRAVVTLNQQLDQLSQELLTERSWYLRGNQLQRDRQRASEDLKKTETARQSLIKPGGKERAEYYTRLGAEVAARQQRIQALDRQLQSYRKLGREVERYQTQVLPRVVQELQQSFGSDLLTDEEWKQFVPQFAGNPSVVVEQRINTQAILVKQVTESEGATPIQSSTAADLGTCGLDALKQEHERVGLLIGTDKKDVQRLRQLNDLYKTQETKLHRLKDDLQRASESQGRIKAILEERAKLYGRFFELVIEQCQILADLYAPLADHLSGAASSASKLSLRVVRSVDLDEWAEAGERLLDLRKVGKFRGHGALAQVAQEHLLTAWQEGTATEVAEAMESFRAANDASLLDQSAVDRNTEQYSEWVINLGRWLYSTDHIKVHYSIEYEGVPIMQLSPGTRGIVLLLLYLALDLEDSRPLIIDQPEENLDPKSVFTELVALFREARKRRQVIVVTHNANLVVNTDVDQVIVASCTKPGIGAPPQFQYLSGGLENPAIRSEVCEILEGGEAAFRQRAQRLRVAIVD